jgi:hypothetical protein
MYSAQTQFSSAKFWRGLNLALGVPAAMLAAVAGTSVLANAVSANTGAAISLVAAAMTAVLTSLNAAQRAEQSRVAANAFLSLQSAARVLRTVDIATLAGAEARQRLEELAQRRDSVNEAAPLPSFLAYKLGRRNIVKGRQEYDVDV